MTDFTDYMENAIMNWFRGTTFPSAPANVYVGLFSSNPTDTGTAGTEITTSVRAAGRLPAGFAAISAGQIVNAADVDFGASASDVTISHVVLFDAVSSGNMLTYKALGAPNIVLIGGFVIIPAGSLKFSVT